MERVLDISVANYDEWLRLVFDHSVAEDESAKWIWEDGLDFEVSDVSVLITHFTRLCNNFVKDTEAYTLPQINAGVWFLFSEPTRLSECLADETATLEARLDCIRAMYVGITKKVFRLYALSPRPIVVVVGDIVERWDISGLHRLAGRQNIEELLEAGVGCLGLNR